MLVSFGLTQEYRIYLFSQIHEIVFHGKGGYNWSDIYNMPIWLRKFTYKKIEEFYEKEKEQQENQQKLLTNKKQDVSRPDIAPKQPPMYKTKATKT